MRGIQTETSPEQRSTIADVLAFLAGLGSILVAWSALVLLRVLL
jgi:hypothetical protein